ncbi:hypothetical protein U1Q18_050433, partial [Sarracenia purpurea var. burkii]
AGRLCRSILSSFFAANNRPSLLIKDHSSHSNPSFPTTKSNHRAFNNRLRDNIDRECGSVPDS